MKLYMWMGALSLTLFWWNIFQLHFASIFPITKRCCSLKYFKVQRISEWLHHFKFIDTNLKWKICCWADPYTLLKLKKKSKQNFGAMSKCMNAIHSTCNYQELVFAQILLFIEINCRQRLKTILLFLIMSRDEFLYKITTKFVWK